jgi:hypothetical protein
LMGWISMNDVHSFSRHTTLAGNPPATISQKTQPSIPPLWCHNGTRRDHQLGHLHEF